MRYCPARVAHLFCFFFGFSLRIQLYPSDLLLMSVQVNLPRARYPHSAVYTNRPGFHEVSFELILMSKQDLSDNGAVRDAILQYTSDACFVEAFVADYMHQMYDCVGNCSYEGPAAGSYGAGPGNCSECISSGESILTSCK